MPQKKKDAKYLNVHIARDLYEQFDEFCKKYGYTKTSATERALVLYMNDVDKKMRTEVQDDAE